MHRHRQSYKEDMIPENDDCRRFQQPVQLTRSMLSSEPLELSPCFTGRSVGAVAIVFVRKRSNHRLEIVINCFYGMFQLSCPPQICRPCEGRCPILNVTLPLAQPRQGLAPPSHVLHMDMGMTEYMHVSHIVHLFI